MLELVPPTARLRDAWTEAHAEWGPGLHEDGFGLSSSDHVDTADGFSAWAARLRARSELTARTDGDAHACTYRWIVQDDRVLGAIALRHGDSDYVRWAGHIGFGIRPSARRRGLATWAMGQMLGEARGLGLDRVLVVCAVDNAASMTTIRRCGGVIDDVRDTPLGPACRFWIDLRPSSDARR